MRSVKIVCYSDGVATDDLMEYCGELLERNVQRVQQEQLTHNFNQRKPVFCHFQQFSCCYSLL